MKAAGIVGVLVAAAASCAAQNPAIPQAATIPAAPPVIRIAVDRIQLDAVVTGRDGRPVTDLRPADFELFVSGRPQKVTNVVYVAGSGASSDCPEGSPSPVPDAAAGRKVVFVIDDLGLSLSGLYQARRALRALARSWEPGDEFALVRTEEEGQRLAFASDAATFDDAVDELQYDLKSVRGVSAASPPVGRFETAPGDPAWARTAFERRLGVLAGTVDALRGRPGRKALVLVSEGLSLPVRPDRVPGEFDRGMTALYGDADVSAALRAMTDLANRGSVVIHAVDPRGLTIDAPDAGDHVEARGGTDRPASVVTRVRWETRLRDQSGLRDLADGTGGLAILSRNDLPDGFGDILADLGAYYLVGWEPEASIFERTAGKPRFHSVKINVRRSGVRVRSRRGFYGLTDEEVARVAPPPALD